MQHDLEARDTSADEMNVFTAGVKAYVKKIIGKFSTFEFHVGDSQHTGKAMSVSYCPLGSSVNLVLCHTDGYKGSSLWATVKTI